MGILTAKRTFKTSDLLMWHCEVTNTEMNMLPADTNRANPVLSQNMVIASIASPGLIQALDQETGEERWKLSLSYIGKSHVYSIGNYLFGGTSQAIISIEPNSGSVLWEFSPYGNDEESIYSSPVCADCRLYLGDRKGWFHCLDADNGQTIWSVMTSHSKRRDVNTTAMVKDDIVITATAAQFVLAYNKDSGSEIWRRHVASYCGQELLSFMGAVIVPTVKSVYVLSITTGQILERWTWRGRMIHSLAVANSILCVALTDERLAPKQFTTVLVGLLEGKEQWQLQYPNYADVSLRWDNQSQWLYEATSYGLGIVNPVIGERVAYIHGFNQGKRDRLLEKVALPSIRADKLYVLDDSGVIYSLHHP